MLPTKIFAIKNKAVTPGSKECVTILACSNENNNHQFRLTLIGKLDKPRAFKILKYTSNNSFSDAWFQKK